MYFSNLISNIYKYKKKRKGKKTILPCGSIINTFLKFKCSLNFNKLLKCIYFCVKFLECRG